MGNPPSDFSFRITADGRVRIAWRDRHVVTLTGHRAEKLIHESANLGDADLQLLLARVTGNFKRGNERPPQKYDTPA